MHINQDPHKSQTLSSKILSKYGLACKLSVIFYHTLLRFP